MSQTAAGEQVAIIRGAGYGKWGMHRPGLYFETWLPDGSATLQLLFDGAARKLMAEAGVGIADVSRLDGRRCHVAVNGYITTFIGLAPAS